MTNPAQSEPSLNPAVDSQSSVTNHIDDTAPRDPSLPEEELDTQPLADTKFALPTVEGDIGSLGKYRVMKELGRGGMGTVYKAFDTKLNRKIALKVMLPKYAANAGAKARFLREARAAAAITHNHIVAVYEADEIDGIPFIAMQYLVGLPLDEYLKKKGLPPIPQIVRIGMEIAAGLHAAHIVGLVHRDIKLGNLWLEAPQGRIKILDFGLAKPTQTEPGAKELTHQGAIVGTPHYMSPEQARGATVDARSDLFSLGVVLYRLCTDRLPFGGTDIFAMLTALAVDDPPSIRILNPDVSAALDDVIMKLLAKKPEDRPATAAETVRLLKAALRGDGPSTGASGVGMPYIAIPLPMGPDTLFADLDIADTEVPIRPAKVRSNKTMIAISAAAALLTLALGAFLVLKLLPKNPPAEVSERKDRTALGTVEIKPSILDNYAPDDPEWQKQFLAALPTRQVKIVADELKKLNPQYTGKIESKTRDGRVVSLTIPNADRVSDIGPVRTLKWLEEFTLQVKDRGYEAGVGDLQDITPLKELLLKRILIEGSKITDISALANAPLAFLNIVGPQLKSNEAVRNMPLGEVKINYATDLTPFANKTIGLIWANDTNGFDLAPLTTCNISCLNSGFHWDKCQNVIPFLLKAKVAQLTLEGRYAPLNAEMVDGIRGNNNILTIHSTPKSIALAAYDLRPRTLSNWYGLSPLPANSVLPVDPKDVSIPLTKGQLKMKYADGLAEWKPLPADDNPTALLRKPSYIQYLEPFEPIVQSLSYLTFQNDQVGPSVLFVGSNRPCEIWLNGRSLGTHSGGNVYSLSHWSGKVDLKSGENVLMLHVNGPAKGVHAYYGFRFSAAIATGEKVTKYLAAKEATKFPPLDPKDGWVDLLKTATPAPGWKKVGNDWESVASVTQTKLPIGEHPSESYELRARFRSGTNAIVFRLPCGSSAFLSSWSGFENANNVVTHDLALIDGKYGPNSPAHIVAEPFQNGDVHEVNIQVLVRGDLVRITTSLDGKPAVHFRGDRKRLDDAGKSWKWPVGASIIVGTFSGQYRLESVHVRPLPTPKADDPLSLYPPLDPAWLARVQALKGEEQAREIAIELQRRNPGFDGVMDKYFTSGVLTSLQFRTEQVSDISPVRAATALKDLVLAGYSPKYAGIVDDISSLEGLKLSNLAIYGNSSVSDISVLSNMPIINLRLDTTGVADLSPLVDKPIESFILVGGKVQDITSLKNAPLYMLTIYHATMKNLTPIRDAKVKKLSLPSSLFDADIVAKWPLETINFSDAANSVPREKLETLRNHPTLKTIDEKPVAEFWKDYDAANPKK